MLSKNKNQITLLLLPIIISYITLQVYSLSLGNDFVNWDDHHYILKTPMIKELGMDFFRWAMSTPVLGNWHPLTMLSFAIDYRLWGFDPWGFHLTNIILHTLNTLLVFIIIKRLAILATEETPPSRSKNFLPIIMGVITALLFGLHPIHVESVTWISERKDVLYAFFFLLSVMAYLGYTKVKKRKALLYILLLIFFALSLMSKPMAVTLPVVLLILDYFPLKRISNLKLIVAEKIPLFIFSALTSFMAIWTQSTGGSMMTLDNLSLYSRVLIALRAVTFYLYKIFIPIEFAPFYPLPKTITIFALEFMVPILLFIVITISSILLIKKHKLFIALWFFYIITLLPVSGIIQVGGQSAADRYMYIASLAPLILISAAVAFLYNKCKKNHGRILIILLMLTVFTMLTIKTRAQSLVWRDSIFLWEHEISIYPRVSRAYKGCGAAYIMISKDFKGAIECFSKGLELNPLNHNFRTKRAATYYFMKNYKASIIDYSYAIKALPQDANLYDRRALAYYRLGRASLAIEDLSRSIAVDPKRENPYFYRASIYFEEKNYRNATEDYLTLLTMTPKSSVVNYRLSEAYSLIGDEKNALKYKKISVKLKESLEEDPWLTWAEWLIEDTEGIKRRPKTTALKDYTE